MTNRTRRVRRKVEMRRIQNSERSQVAFSQRCDELSKLVNEMSILTGAEVAIVGLSPNNRAFSIGCPNVESVINKYENQFGCIAYASGNHASKQSPQIDEEDAKEISRLEKELEGQKRRAKMLDEMLVARSAKNWWDAPIENLELNQLEELLKAHQVLFNDITKKVIKMTNAPLSDDQVPNIVDIPENATIPYLVNKLSSLGEGSSNALSHFDYEKSGGINGVVQCDDYARTNFDALEMVASTSGLKSKGSFKGTEN